MCHETMLNRPAVRVVAAALGLLLAFSLVPSVALADVLPSGTEDLAAEDALPASTEGEGASDAPEGAEALSGFGTPPASDETLQDGLGGVPAGEASEGAAVAEASAADGAVEPAVLATDAAWDGKDVIVRSAKHRGLVLDCQAGGTAPGTNVQTYYSNHTAAQHFTLTAARGVDGAFTGYYLVFRAGSSVALATVDGNVELASAGSADFADAVLWALEENADGTVTFVSKATGQVVDVFGGSTKAGANVWLHESNGTAAQRFFLEEVDLAQSQVLADANYLISTALDPHVQSSFDIAARSGFMLDVADASTANGANVQIVFDNGSNAQRWRAVYLGDGYYRFESLVSGKVLDCAAGGTVPGTNVQQYEYNETYAQQFKLVDAGNGFYYLSPESSPALYVSVDGAAAWATNVCLSDQQTDAQRFRFTKSYRGATIGEGPFQITTSLNAGFCLDVTGGSKSAGANVQLYSFNYTAAQRFRFTYVQSREAYTIVNGASGMALTVAGTGAGANVYQDVLTGADSQLWQVSADASGAYVITSVLTGCVLDVDNASTVAGTNIKVWNANGSAAQRFYLTDNAIATGSYSIYPKAYSGNAVSIEQNGAAWNGANVEISGRSGSIAQRFWLAPHAAGGYEIRTWCSDKLLEPANGSVADGTNVWTYSATGSASQAYLPQVTADGYYRFVLVADQTKCLAAVPGANVVIQTVDENSDYQKFNIEPTTSPYSGNVELDWCLVGILNAVGRDNPDMLRATYNYVTGFRYVSGSLRPTGDWSVPFAIEMAKNGGGNCYRFAALYCWLARALGYDANVVSGYLLTVSGAQSPHGWVEIRINGTTYVFDPDMANSYPQYNWYYNTYATTPLVYYFY